MINVIVATSYFVRTRAQMMAKGRGCNEFASSQSYEIPDAMHTIKYVIEHIFNIITGKEDSNKVRNAEIQLGRLCLQQCTPDT